MNKRQTLIIVIIAILLVAVGAASACAYFIPRLREKATSEAEAQAEAEEVARVLEETGLELDTSATSDLVLPGAEESEAPAESIRIAGYPEIAIDADEEEVVLNLLNPEGNPCYFIFTLSLKDTGEVLYTSKAVAPGKSIGTATLTRALAEGEYDAVIHIATASLVDGSAMNDANLETKLIVR